LVSHACGAIEGVNVRTAPTSPAPAAADEWHRASGAHERFCTWVVRQDHPHPEPSSSGAQPATSHSE
jgi:hypothetical protein